MRNRFTITITEISGSRHYELHQVFKRLLRYAVTATAVIVVAAASLIVFLNRSVNDLEAKRSVISDRLSTLLQENGTLVQEINARVAEFQEIDQRIEFLEEMVGMEATSNLSLAERMELASLVIARREKEFKEIGNRVRDIEGMIGLEGEETQAEEELMERVNLASLTAAQKRMMLDNIPNGYPVEPKGITSGFGQRNHPTLNRTEFHAGLDLRAAMRTPVVATADGVVEYAGHHKKSGYGVLLMIRHNFGFLTLYGHLSKTLVKSGQFVKKGEVVAETGNSGLSSGPHLHYEIRFIQRSLDPTPFMQWSLQNYQVVFKEQQVKWQSLVSLINQRLMNPTPPSLQLAQR